MLAIAAARLGWGPVTALELDPGAAGVIGANARANGVEVEARTHDLRAGSAVGADRARQPPSPCCSEDRRPLEPPPERLVIAGLLARYADEVAPLTRRCARPAALVEDEWAAVVLA